MGGKKRIVDAAAGAPAESKGQPFSAQGKTKKPKRGIYPDATNQTIVLQQRKRLPNRKKGWGPWEVLLHRDRFELKQSHTFNLPKGGFLRLWTGLFSEQKIRAVDAEMSKIRYRQYPIQGVLEPRLHRFFHKHTMWPTGYDPNGCIPEDDLEDERLGYGYSNLYMKSIPAYEVPLINEIASDLERTCKVEWNIGIHCILYRDGNDSQGMHADDNQGETRIAAALIRSPAGGRRVLIESKAGDEQYQLHVQQGDVYEMDGTMQRFYLHSVPKEPSQVGGEAHQRKVLVLRAGRARYVTRDTGRLVSADSKPEAPRQILFGPIAGLIFGNLYRREELRQIGAHVGHRRGVSGNRFSGANAIILNGDGDHNHDLFGVVLYAADNLVGGKAILRTHTKKESLRVFRAIQIETNGKKRRRLYRYDGLYHIVCCHIAPQNAGFCVLAMDNWSWEDRANAGPAAQKQEPHPCPALDELITPSSTKHELNIAKLAKNLHLLQLNPPIARVKEGFFEPPLSTLPFS